MLIKMKLALAKFEDWFFSQTLIQRLILVFGYFVIGGMVIHYSACLIAVYSRYGHFDFGNIWRFFKFDHIYSSYIPVLPLAMFLVLSFTALLVLVYIHENKKKH